MALNILVVDDSDVIRAMIGRTLALARIDVGTLFEAANGRDALDVLADEWVDLVLADINMPVMTGAEMLARMREDPDTEDVPVIVVSTEGATERVEELTALGVSAWIRKPFTPEEISSVISQVTVAWSPPLDPEAVDLILTQVLETFAFVLPESLGIADLPEAQGELVCATMNFSGAASGSMSIAAPTDLCVELAANVMGVDEEDSNAVLLGADTLGEILNIAAGHIATTVDPSAPTHLHPPVVARIDRAGWETLTRASGARGYLVEDRPVVASAALRLTPAS